MTVVEVPRDWLSRFGGHPNCYDDVLVSIPKEDRVREVSPSFNIYAVDLVDVHEQNRFRNQYFDDLQPEFGFADEVNPSFTLIDEPNIT